MSFEKGDCERRDGDGEGPEGRWQPDLQYVLKTHTVTRSEHSLISDDTLGIIFVYFLWSWIFVYFHLHVRILLTKGYLG